MGDEVQLYHTLVYALIWHHKWCVATLLGELHLSGHGLDLRTNLIAVDPACRHATSLALSARNSRASQDAALAAPEQSQLDQIDHTAV